MSLADELLADLDGLSDGGPSDEEQDNVTISGPSKTASSSGSGFGSMLPPPVPKSKGKRSADAMETDEANGKGNGHGDEEEDEDEGDDDLEAAGALNNGSTAVGYVPEGGVRPADELDSEDVEGLDLAEVEDVKSVAKLLEGKRLNDTLEQIKFYEKNPTDMTDSGGPIEENPEYALIVTANNLSVEVENELMLVHKFIRDHYAQRFPELEQLIGDPWTYIAAVEAIGNAPDLSKAPLPPSLPPATVLSITLTASTSPGLLLSPGQFATVTKACAVANRLKTAREAIFAYVESRMAALAPNLSALVGTGIAAKLLGLAGGLNAFATVPSCNVMLFGALKKNLANSHMSSRSIMRHTGFIYQSPIVQSAQLEDRKKAQRAVAAKVTLAARTDAARASRDGSYGKKLLQALHQKIQKLAEPPPNKLIKALPVPQETNKKKRGGRRVRKQKEAFAQTELRKQQNRMEFGKAEEETGAYDETIGLGMIGANSGRVRGQLVDAKSRAKMSRKNQIRTQTIGRSAIAPSGSSSESGLATSLSFTPVQGLEIATPSLSAAQRVQAANDRWFASGTFTHVKKESSNIPGQGGFSK